MKHSTQKILICFGCCIGIILIILLFSFSYALFSFEEKGNVENSLITGVASTSNLRSIVLRENKLIEKEPTLTTSSNNTTDESGLYKSTTTNTGAPTYYFRGSVENNYVSFAGFMWRIVRINEDGTIRLIMQDGINSNANVAFNSNSNNYTYMYYSNSNVKTQLENWYNTNIGNNDIYTEHIASGNYYCEQARVKYGSGWTAGNAVMILYSSYIPDFKCSDDGNKMGLINANVGLITYDELLYAGGYWGQVNQKYYMYNTKYFWTMSSSGYSSTDGGVVWSVNTEGRVSYDFLSRTYTLRPVINLKADTEISKGTGTSSDPYVVKLKNLTDVIISDNKLIEKEPTLTDSSNNTSDESGLYKSIDTNTGKPTYYFRGNVDNNYVSFAGQIWRIVRVNEDGTIRIVMQDGINSNTNYRFNNLNYYEYSSMYYSNSQVKSSLENWYQTNIGNKTDLASIVASGNYYCEQAKAKYDSSWTSGSTTMTLYSSYTPDFKCTADGNGKGLVNASVGLLSYDEMVYAGGYYGKSNNNYYLYNKNTYFWTMSPAGFSGSISYVWYVYTTGNINYFSVGDNNRLRAVLNIKADTGISKGIGTSSDPYVIG